MDAKEAMEEVKPIRTNKIKTALKLIGLIPNQEFKIKYLANIFRVTSAGYVEQYDIVNEKWENSRLITLAGLLSGTFPITERRK